MLVLTAVLAAVAGVTLWLVTRKGASAHAGSGLSSAPSPNEGPDMPILPPLPLTNDQRARIERLRREFSDISEVAFQSYEDESQLPAAKDALWDLKARLREGEVFPPSSGARCNRCSKSWTCSCDEAPSTGAAAPAGPVTGWPS